MDWMIANLAPDGDSANLPCQSQLGFYVGETYKVTSKAAFTLSSISANLASEDKSVRSFRRKLGFSQLAHKALAPILVHTNTNKDSWQVFAATIKLLVDMTTPLECLFASVGIDKSEEGAQTVFELKQHLSDIKNIFLDPRIARSILIQVERLLNRSDDILSCERNCLINCVTLLRNVLHIPETSPNGSENDENDDSSQNNSPANHVKRQHQILWNLFAHNLNSVIMSLIESRDFKTWATPLVQLIALVYKDQQVSTLERLLNVWLESSSSEDNESNTTPHDRAGNGYCSSQVLTSSDESSDGNAWINGGKASTCNPKKSKFEDNADSGISEEPPKNYSKKPSTQTAVKHKYTKVSRRDKTVNNNLSKPSKITCDVEMRYESESSDSSCKEPPRKKVAKSSENSSSMKVSNCWKPKDHDSGLSSPPMTPMTTGHSDCSTVSNVGNSQQNIHPSWSSSSGSNCGVRRASRDLVAVGNKLQQSILEKKDHHYSGESTSSNDEEARNKRNVIPHINLQRPRPKKIVISPEQKKELRRKKLIDRSKSKDFKVKALIQHMPTDEDIADLLKDFTVDFLLKGYPSLVADLRSQLMSAEDPDIDKSHLLWLITYFLKFSSQLEVELDQIGTVLSIETVAYLTYEGVRFFEELELAIQEKRDRVVDLRPHLRRIHLIVTALRAFIQTLQAYLNFAHFSEVDKEKLRKLQMAVCSMRDLRQLFLLLIRRYNSSLHTRQYLNDVICGNHALLMMIESTKMDMVFMPSHLAQFASVEVMSQYGQLLETFDSNSESVNDCIFTMMHHVCGDLNTPETLFMPQILATFSAICEREDIEICDDWGDLIEYVIQKFISTIGSRPPDCASHLKECLNTNTESSDENDFTKLQLDTLDSYYMEFEDSPDAVGCVIELYKRNSNVTKTRQAVIQALLSQGNISLVQYMNMIYMKSVLTTFNTTHEDGSVVVEVGSDRCDSEEHDTALDNTKITNINLNTQQYKDEIETLKELVTKQGKESLLEWLQQTLLDACCVKINTGTGMLKTNGESLEPVPYHFNYINQSIPMVAWSKTQGSGLQTESFMLLLKMLGFHMAADVGKCFPRIPHFWSADHLYNLALKIGPLRKEELKLIIGPDISLLDTQEVTERINAAVNEDLDGLKPLSFDQPITSLPSPIVSSSGFFDGPSGPPPIDPPITSTSDFNPFAIPRPTKSWLQLAKASKRASSSMSKAPSKRGLLSKSSKCSVATFCAIEQMQIFE